MCYWEPSTSVYFVVVVVVVIVVTMLCVADRSLGIKVEPGSALVSEIKEKSHHNTISEEHLRNILSKFIPSLAESWPAHNDVLRAFKVFDTEGVGFIKVTMLKRFLVQAQLEVDESVCKSPSITIFYYLHSRTK